MSVPKKLWVSHSTQSLSLSLSLSLFLSLSHTLSHLISLSLPLLCACVRARVRASSFVSTIKKLVQGYWKVRRGSDLISDGFLPFWKSCHQVSMVLLLWKTINPYQKIKHRRRKLEAGRERRCWLRFSSGGKCNPGSDWGFRPPYFSTGGHGQRLRTGL
jgi:hypothetical protein